MRTLLLVLSLFLFGRCPSNCAAEVSERAGLYVNIPWDGERGLLFALYSDGSVLFRKQGIQGTGLLKVTLEDKEYQELAKTLAITPEFLELERDYNPRRISDRPITVIKLKSGAGEKSVSVKGFEEISDAELSKELEDECQGMATMKKGPHTPEEFTFCLAEIRKKWDVPHEFLRLYKVMNEFSSDRAVPWIPRCLIVHLETPERIEKGVAVPKWPEQWPRLAETKETSSGFFSGTLTIPGSEYDQLKKITASKGFRGDSFVNIEGTIWSLSTTLPLPDNESGCVSP